jgi:hypothetical protein
LRRGRNRDGATGLDSAGWLTLPSSGYDGPIPRWPLLPDIGLRAKKSVAEAKVSRLEWELADATGDKRASVERRLEQAQEQVAVLSFQVAEQEKREKGLWREAWRSPQAHAWAQRVGWTRDVAQYVRHKVLAELGSMEDAKEARQWSDRLGLNPAAMLRNRWRLAPDQVTPRRAEKPAPAPAAPARVSARDRLKAVNGGGA